MLDLNSDFSNNGLQLNSPFQAPAAFASQQTASSYSSNFTDMLASAQAESEQLQVGTVANSISGQVTQATNSLLSFSSTDRSLGTTSYPGGSSTLSEQMAWQRSNSDLSQPLPVYQNRSMESAVPLNADSSSETVVTEPPTSSEPVSGGGQINTAQESVSNASSNDGPRALTSTRLSSQPSGDAGSGSEDLEPANQSPSTPAQKSLAGSSVNGPATSEPASGVVAGCVPKPAPAASDQADSATPASTLNLKAVTSPDKAADKAVDKAVDKAKNHKEKSSAAGNGIMASTQSESGAAPIQPAPVSTTANPAILTDAGGNASAGGNSSEPALKSRNSNKADSFSGLAFALKIQGNDPVIGAASQANSAANQDLDNSDPASQSVASLFSSEMAGFMQPSEQKAGARSGSSSDPASSGVTNLLNTSSLSASQANTAASASDAKPAEEVAPASNVLEDEPALAQQVKTVQVQITGSDDQKVDLRLVEKSGSLTMSVRSSDSSLTTALRQNLPDLTNKLSDQQIHADWWRPEARQADTSRNSSGSGSSGDNSPNQDQSGSNQGGSGQRGGRGTPQPDWLEDLSISPKSNQNGTQFSWHL